MRSFGDGIRKWNCSQYDCARGCRTFITFEWRRTLKRILHFEPTSPYDFGEYRVLIEKDGEFHRCIQYTQMSETAMMDIVPDLRKKYPVKEGYKVTW